MHPAITTKLVASYQAWLRRQLELQRETIQGIHAELACESEKRLGLLISQIQAPHSNCEMPGDFCHWTFNRAPDSEGLAKCVESAGSLSSSMDQVELEYIPSELEEIPPSQSQACRSSGSNVGLNDQGHGTACKQQQYLAESLLKAKNWAHTSLEDECEDDTANLLLNKSVRMQTKSFVEGRFFTLFVTMLICFNSLLMLLEIEEKGRFAREALQGGVHDHEDAMMAKIIIAERICTLIFSIELVLRTYAIRIPVLKSFLYWVDLLCTIAAIWEMLSPNPILNVTFMRLIRLSKFSRVIKSFRTLKQLAALRVLLVTIQQSMPAFIWSMVVLGVIQACAAIFISKLLHPIIMDSSLPKTVRLHAFTYFGSASRSLFSMFELTFGGPWANIARPIVENDPAFAIFFILYISVVTFAIMRIVTAIFLRETLQATHCDEDLMIKEGMAKHSQQVLALREIFQEADSSKDGLVTAEEFEGFICKPRAQAWMASVNLQAHEVIGLFDLLQSKGGVSLDEFILGMIQQQHSGQAVDALTLLYSNQRLLLTINNLEEKIDELSCQVQGRRQQKHETLFIAL